MIVSRIYSFLLQVGKGIEPQPSIRGTRIQLNGKLFEMLRDLFDRSDDECKTDIAFRPSEDGEQKNDCRDEIVELLSAPGMGKARRLAERLQAVTTNRSGLGLLFIIIGTDENTQKICISRFPADIGILAEEGDNGLNVEYLEKVFMRNAYAYKAVIYSSASPFSDLWDGKAIDKQTKVADRELSSYWIQEFLLSDFRTTSLQGTRRLANALKSALEQDISSKAKQEIVNVASLAQNLDGKVTSISDLADYFNLSHEAKGAIEEFTGQSMSRHDRFVLSADEFGNVLRFRSIELDTGVMLTARPEDFERHVERNPVGKDKRKMKFTTTGEVIDERLRSRKW